MITHTVGISLLVLIFAMPASVRERRMAAPAPAKSTCERGSYPGDPICDVGGDVASTALPTPKDRQGNRGREGGVAVTDDISVKGRSDFNDNRYGGTGFYNPNLRPGPLEGVNGGAGLDYKF